jgi:hypothetical protein
MLLCTIILVSPAVGRLTNAVNVSELYELITGIAASIVLLVLFDLGSGGIRRSTLLLIVAAVLLETVALVFAIGFLQDALAQIMLAV